METWLIYAIASIFLAGIYSFLVKVASHKHYSPSLITGYWYLSAAVFSGVYLLYTDINWDNLGILIAISSIQVVFYFFSTLTRMESMKNIDSVLFFPIFKTISPILVTVSWLLIFQEALSIKEIIWILVWITVPLLLISTHEKKRQVNLKRGLIFLVYSSLLVLVSTLMIKQASVLLLDLQLFVFVSAIAGLIVSWVSYKTIQKQHKKKWIDKKYSTKNIYSFAVILGFFNVISFYTFAKALEGNLAIAFTINSFSILIPIILSIIFYKDHFNMKKAFVIGLSIVSILLFI
jgi:drug/metabolite transporter (DMT)-like permease